MPHDFDRVIERRGTDCEKFDFAAQHGLPEDVLPLWVADMDFAAPSGVLDALRQRVEHGIFGYTGVKDDYVHAVTDWFEARHGWKPEAEWLVETPGVVYALATAVRALTEKGDAVLIQTPVYRPFFNVVKSNHRRLVECPLSLRNGRYEIDFDAFEAAIRDNAVKLFILCSPHNPVGRVWTQAELARIGAICARYGVYVVSDEIHCDFTWPEHPHTPFTVAAPEHMDRSIVCTAPSKTFNIAGLQTSNIFIPGRDARERFKAELEACGFFGPNCAGLLACKAAYQTGGPWLDDLKRYLRGNVDFMRDYLREHLPMLQLIEPEGTYLTWVDFSALSLSPDALNDMIVHKARLWLDDGRIFGDCGAQYQRFVLACPRATLRQAMEQLDAAIHNM